MRISKQFVKDNAPSDGATARSNHNEHGCNGDSESVVLRNENGRISAKCYRCGAFQVVELGGYVAKQKPVKEVERSRLPPSDMSPNWQVFPSEARDWLGKANILPSMELGISWSEKQKRLIIPANNPYQRWWLARSFDSKETRYKTIAGQKDAVFGFVGSFPRSDCIWICEDLLSMYRLNLAGANALALCTTTISDKAVALLARMRYNRAIVALDNDNPQVIMANSVIAKRLGWMKQVERSSLLTDPKYYSHDELRKVCNELH
jgi:hypothetical protein